MTSQANTTDPILDALVSQCFRGGEVLLRELRLTPEQARPPGGGLPGPGGGPWARIGMRSAFRRRVVFYVN